MKNTFYELGYSNFERENNDVLIFSGEEDQSFVSAALGLRLVYRLDNKPVDLNHSLNIVL